MGNYRLAWVLLFSYVSLLGLSTCGVGVSLLLSKPPQPVLPKINVTKSEPDESNYNSRHRYNQPETPQELKDYAEASHLFSDYGRDLQIYLALPCSLTALIATYIILGGLCSRKIFSTSIGLYSSVALFGVNLAGAILFQNSYNEFVKSETMFDFTVILGIQSGMLVLLTFQMISAVVEMRRQKIKWPVMHISHIFTFHTLFLAGRIALGVILVQQFVWSTMWSGFHDNQNDDLFKNMDYWQKPTIKMPEVYAYYIGVTVVYGVVASSEALLSHLLGHLHTRMLSFTTLLSTLLYGGVIALTSPAFAQIVLGAVTYPEVMNLAIGAMFLSFMHTIGCLVASQLMRSPPAILTELCEVCMDGSSNVPYNSEAIRTRAAAMRRKFKGSDTLLFNSIILVLNGLSLILEVCRGVYWWGGIMMLCGNVVVMSRLLPAVVSESVTQKMESTSLMKIMINAIIECTLLFVGICGSFYWFYDEIAAAIIINAIIVLLMVITVVKNPLLRGAIANLRQENSERRNSTSLMDESSNETESVREENNQESGGIYQPLA